MGKSKVGFIVAALGCAMLLLLMPGEPERPGRSAAQASLERPNVLVVLIDTLRKDHLGLYGYPRDTSKTIDALGEQGWIFDNHIAHASQTVPSTLSMMLSQYPAEHGFVHRARGQFANNPPQYPAEFLFLAEVFSAADYQTAGFVGNSFLGPENGFGQGFETFQKWRGKGEKITQKALRWMRQSSPERPFFLYLHYIDVHHPYEHPRTYTRRFPFPENGRRVYTSGLVEDLSPQDLAYTVSSYDAGIPYLDDQIADLLGELEFLGLRDDTIVVVTSDHGEEFMDHGGLGHGTTVFGELVRVPLIISYPKKLEPGKRVTHITQHLDLAPTLLHLADLDRPQSFRGRSLFQPANRVYTEGRALRAMYADGKKLILNRETGETALYDAHDELDQKPLNDEVTTRRLLGKLQWYLDLEDASKAADDSDREAQPWSDEDVEHLRALGYID